jgi:hypothetical protein
LIELVPQASTSLIVNRLKAGPSSVADLARAK